jgi:hypothetical protein
MSGNHNANQKPIKTYHALPLALRLAHWLERDGANCQQHIDAAAELRRQHAEIEALREALLKCKHEAGSPEIVWQTATAALAQGEKT